MLQQMNNLSEWIIEGEEAMDGQLCHNADLQHLKQTKKKTPHWDGEAAQYKDY